MKQDMELDFHRVRCLRWKAVLWASFSGSGGLAELGELWDGSREGGL